MPRAGLGTEQVVNAAAELADSDGLDGLTLARLAERLGIRPPSLYAHIRSLEDLHERLAARGAAQLAGILQRAAAGRARTDALEAVAHAYRAYAKQHPGTYAALQRARYTAAGAPGREAAGRLVDVVVAALRGYELEGDDAIHATRIIRSALHGLVALEALGGFGLELSPDETFERLIITLDRGLTSGD